MISINELATLISAFTSVTTLLLGLFAFVKLHMQVEVIRHETDGMKTELVNEVRAASLAKGKLQEQERTGNK